MKLKGLVKDAKFYIGVFPVACAIVGTAFGFFKLPGKVEAVEKKQEVTEDKVQSLANTVEQYIAVQKTKEDAEDKQDELLLKLIEKLVDK